MRSDAVRLAHVTTADLSLRFLLANQLQAYRRAGYQVLGISAPGPWVRELEDEGIPHLAVPALQRRWDPRADVEALRQLVRILRRSRPAIVHTHTPKAGVLGRIAARLAGVPIVVNTVHGLFVGHSPGARQGLLLLERLAARCSDFELCQSREDLLTLRRLRIVDPQRSAYLGNGVDLQHFDPGRVDGGAARRRLGLAPEAIVIGTVGRLVWEKGYREVFAMAEVLRAIDPRIVVLAVGPQEAGKRDAVPPAVIEELARRQMVRFLGMRTDMPDLYAAMDIFVLASHREGFPRSAVEAAAMARPLVLTDIRGCREVVEDGRGGFLVPPGDAPALADRVRRLVADPGLRARFGQDNRQKALVAFDERRIIEVTLNLYWRLRAGTSRVQFAPGGEVASRG